MNLKTRLKKLGERIIETESLLYAGHVDNPDWLADNLFMFQRYNPELFNDQFSELLSDLLLTSDGLEQIKSKIKNQSGFAIDLNTQVKKFPFLDNVKFYSYSTRFCAEKGRALEYSPKIKTYKLPIKLIESKYEKFRMRAAYCKNNNILFIQIQYITKYNEP